MSILNLTQHHATPEQLAAGVVNLPNDKQSQLVELLTFNDIPKNGEMYARATAILQLALSVDDNCNFAMIGGAPFFMSILEDTLENAGVQALYAFSARQSVETQNADGTVVKQTVFKHLGFVGF